MRGKGAHLVIWPKGKEGLFRMLVVLVNELFLPFTLHLTRDNARRVGVHCEMEEVNSDDLRELRAYILPYLLLSM